MKEYKIKGNKIETPEGELLNGDEALILILKQQQIMNKT